MTAQPLLSEIFYTLDGNRRVQREKFVGWNSYVVEARKAKGREWGVVLSTHSRSQALDVCSASQSQTKARAG